MEENECKREKRKKKNHNNKNKKMMKNINMFSQCEATFVPLLPVLQGDYA
jgi:GTP cyclohydrolase I